MNFNRLFHAVAALMLLSGCSADLTDKPLVVSDVDALEATAEFAEGTDDNIRVLKIRSNRSWYAHLNNVNDPVPVTETVEWGQIDVCEHFNLTGAMDEVEITVSFNRNYSQVPVNGVLNFYAEGQLFMSVPVRQDGAVYRLAPSADRTEAACGEDHINIAVDCNTAWTAEILAGGTADATLSATEGFDAGTLQVNFAENFDPSQTKTVTVRFKAESCQDQDIIFIQSKAVPYIRLHESTETDLGATATEGKIAFQTNCPWRAEVVDGSLLLTDLSETEGEAGVKGTQEIAFKVTNNGTDVGILSKASIKIIPLAEDVEPLVTEFSQRPGLVIDFKANPFDPAMVSARSTSVENTNLVIGNQSYKVSYYLSYYGGTDWGMRFIGGSKPDFGYFQLPVVPGLTLEYMEFFIRGHNSLYGISARVEDASGNIYSSLYAPKCHAEISNNRFAHNVYYSFMLPVGEALEGDGNASKVMQTSPGGEYRLASTANVNCIIQKLILYYE